MSSFEITGIPELDRKMTDLEKKVQKKISRSAVTKSLRVVAKGMKDAIPSKYKNLRKSIKPRFKKNKRKGFLEAKVGANVAQKNDKQYKLAHLLLAGTKDRYTKAGKYTGKMKEQTWLADGYNNSISAAEKRLVDGLREGLEKEANKK